MIAVLKTNSNTDCQRNFKMIKNMNIISIVKIILVGIYYIRQFFLRQIIIIRLVYFVLWLTKVEPMKIKGNSK